MQKVSVEVNGVMTEVPAVRRGLEVWYHLDGITHKYEVQSKCHSGGASNSDEANGVFSAQMPGKIMKVNVAQGDKVSAGQVLLVMEAMKMEYSIESPFDGEIETLECKADQQVAAGDLLVKIQKS